MSRPAVRHIPTVKPPPPSDSAWHRAAQAWAEYLLWADWRRRVIASLETKKASD